MQNSWYANSQATSSVEPKIPFMNTAIPKKRCRRRSKKPSRQDRKVSWVVFFLKNERWRLQQYDHKQGFAYTAGYPLN